MFTGERLCALLPTIPRLKGPATDRRWDDPKDGPAKVEISESGVQMDIDIGHVDPRFHGRLSLHYKTSIPGDVLATVPTRSLGFAVSAEYVFHMLGVRVRSVRE